jgi:hypothetical protein
LKAEVLTKTTSAFLFSILNGLSSLRRGAPSTRLGTCLAISCSSNRETLTSVFAAVYSRRQMTILLKNPQECFDKSQHERKILNDYKPSSVRPEALEG